MKVLVTGANGFIGSHLTRMLTAEGHEVGALIRATSSLQQFKDLGFNPTLFQYKGTVDSLCSVLTEWQPKVVIHLATHFVGEHALGDIDGLVGANILFGTQLLEAMRHSGPRVLVNAGTAWQHYLEKSRDYNPVNLYAATKQAFADLLFYYTHAQQFSAITLKLFDTYGPHDPRKKLVRLLETHSKSGVPLKMSPGEQHLDLLYVDDACRAFSVAMKQAVQLKPGENLEYSLRGGQRMTLQRVVEIFNDVSDVPVLVEWGARPYREREVMLPWEMGEALPGWKPQVELAQGLELTLGFR